MPAGFQHIPVPLFRKYEVILAELCAYDLWNGVDYATGKQMAFSDEEFLQMFSAPVEAMYKNPRTRQKFTEVDIRSLLISAKLKALFRSTIPTDFQSGIAGFRSAVMPVYRGLRDKTLKLSSTEYATQAILAWSTTFVNNTTGVSRNGNHRVPLACRVLFYATPDMEVFNFSNALTKAMRFQSRPQAALGDFNLALDAGLKTNRLLFSKLKMPKPTILGDDVWTRAKKNGWWQRRVLDLALLLRFRVFVARRELQVLARALAAKP